MELQHYHPWRKYYFLILNPSLAPDKQNSLHCILQLPHYHIINWFVLEKVAVEL